MHRKGTFKLAKPKKSKGQKERKGDTTKTHQPGHDTPDIRDLKRELDICLEFPNPRDVECVRLIVNHAVNDKLRLLERNSHLGEANKELLRGAIEILNKLTA